MINRAACGILFLDLFLLSLYFLELNKIAWYSYLPKANLNMEIWSPSYGTKGLASRKS